MIRLQHADREALLAVVRAQSRLLRAGGAEEVAAALRDAVTELGGAVVPAAEAGEALPFDLSCGTGEAALPTAPAGSRAHARLQHVLPALVEEARLAIARATHDTRQAELVLVDALTGLMSRRAAERLLRRVDGAAAVAVLDLDHFKQVNDVHGHAAGDEVLAALGRLLRERGRAQDRYGRLGGEELLGVFPDTSPDEVVAALTRLRDEWRDVAPYAVTFSAGVASVGSRGGEQALAAADEALYAAKRAGRDAVRVAPAPDEAAPGASRPLPGRLPPPVLPAFMDHLEEGRSREATDLVLGLLDGGLPLQDVIRQLLVPAQREVGHRWETGRWSVAEEHLATSVVDAVLAAAAFRAGRVHTEGEGGWPVLVVSPEGEWHQLPARMVATLLAEVGIAAVNLGPSLPERDLQRVLAGRRYGAVVLSCTLATSLVTAAGAVRAAHEANVPVLAGGQGFGPDGRRAQALGADGWADSTEVAAELLGRWRVSPPALAVPSVVALAEPLAAAVGPDARRRVVERLRRRRPVVVPDEPSPLAATYDDLGHVLRHLDAALAVDDPRLFLDFTRWLAGVLTVRGVPVEAVVAGYEELEAELDPRQERAARVLREARRLLGEPTGVPD